MGDIIITAFTAQAKELLDIKDKIKFLKNREKELSDGLQETCDFKTVSHDGYTYAVIERLGPVRYSDIPGLRGMDLEPYRETPVVSWRLSFQRQFNI